MAGDAEKPEPKALKASPFGEEKGDDLPLEFRALWNEYQGRSPRSDARHVTLCEESSA
jgi:hypothetical protein